MHIMGPKGISYIIVSMFGPDAIALFVLLNIPILINGYVVNSNSISVDNDFEDPNNDRMNIISEYEVERYSFPAVASDFDANIVYSESENSAILYRISSSPKSPRSKGKPAVYVEHAISCNVETCFADNNRLSTVYPLVDRGYDAWLGVSNSSINEEAEEDRLRYIARYITSVTEQQELLVMTFSNVTNQFLKISVETAPAEKSNKKSTLSLWFEKIPGVTYTKQLYNKVTNDIKHTYEVVKQYVVQKFRTVFEDSSIARLKDNVLGLWGSVMRAAKPTLNIEDFSKMITHPDIYLSTPQLIAKYEYNGESHDIKTEDGYLLTVHRISGSRKHPPRKGKPAVLVQHGVLTSSAVWVLTGPSKALAYILADAGYDVWLGNARGTTYSRGHVNLTTKDNDYWNFSFHEMAIYDLPATIDYMIARTGQSKVYYIGHSQGATTFFAMMSEKPEYHDKITKFVAYAPVVYANRVKSPIISHLSKIGTPIYRALNFLNIHDFVPTNSLLTKIGREMCEGFSVMQVVCSNTLFLVAGYDSEQINRTTLPILIGHLPAGGSVKQFLHFAQELKAKRFQKFDYLDPAKNIAKYGQSTPPLYKIENARVPMAIFYGANDWLADPEDVEKLAQDVPHAELVREIAFEKFNHIDFMFAIDAPTLVYQPTIEYLQAPVNTTR